MKTRHPLILTARIAEKDLEQFDRLRQAHFPPDRNFLRAHLTMFHRLPGEYEARIVDALNCAAESVPSVTAEVSGVRHLGAGVAFVIACPPLEAIRGALKSAFVNWLGSQDMQTWRPHITIQNKVARVKADELYRDLQARFEPRSIEIVGLDLWAYLGGPWQHLALAPFGSRPQA
ncbi:2'-5' RNA ligase family protein (plasmid) [Aliirhizobium terrae]|uniref:2'-5' RNA ligase family protein n=1 Tax=Terrirhizobium terrae TaxID=2926709 RepID=UPI0025790200|nr:2'-5' RNA ligase family protein [Rhizobium sp. CC-CFT758]WJH38590.1 2'-5' RNA ligase family protein [Rhizobium sp. CC-CFT758]